MAGNLNKIIRDVESLWRNDFLEFLTEEDHGLEIRLLARNYEDFRRKRTALEELRFEAKAVSNRTWEELNVGKWTEVPEGKKQVYGIAAFIQIVIILHENPPEALKKALEVTDMGILLGSPFRSLSLTKVADILSESMQDTPASTSAVSEAEPPAKKLKLQNEVETVIRPSLEAFEANYLKKNRPVKLTDCMDHWPALKLWKDLNYIVKKAGHRTVPIELGKHYADGSYSQKLMKISDFVAEYFGGDPQKIGYLAQHQLFDQVPELRKDIAEPDYCALSQEPDSETEINAWFGPKGTVSPLHHDPKHNLLCQVVGSKKIILYSQTDSQYLYPHEGSLLFNTSRVDAENPDLNTYPDFAKATREECVLNPGEMLYIPPRYWHHVRALENSFSVTFWWS